MDPDEAQTPYDRHGSDDLHRVDLRSFASACGEGEGRSSADGQSDCRSEEEERQDRCRQDRRLLTLRLPARVPHGINGDPRPAPHVALSQPGGQADGADEEPCLRTADGDRRELQQAAASQSWLLPRNDNNSPGCALEYTAAA